MEKIENLQELTMEELEMVSGGASTSQATGSYDHTGAWRADVNYDF